MIWGGVVLKGYGVFHKERIIDSFKMGIKDVFPVKMSSCLNSSDRTSKVSMYSYQILLYIRYLVDENKLDQNFLQSLNIIVTA